MQTTLIQDGYEAVPLASNNTRMTQLFLDVEETSKLINEGNYLVVAGDESFLEKLPSGNWIGGTIPYFMSDEGGIETSEKAFVNVIHDALSVKIKNYSKKTINKIAKDASTLNNGFTIIIMPCGTDVHQVYASHALTFPNMGDTPIIGWVSGVHLWDLNAEKTPKCINGNNHLASSEDAIAIHIELPANQKASVGIINPFEQSEGDYIEFPEDGLSTMSCIINGENINFAEYLEENEINIQMPLIAEQNGYNVNVSIQSADEFDGSVKFYAPVFKGVKYRFAKKISDYVQNFENIVNNNPGISESQFSANCILNFMYSNLEGRKTGSLIGPTTFGEIAYQLLNQTAVYLTITEV